MRKILITGGAGFVGRHFVKRFLDAGDLVVVVDSIVPRTGGIDPVRHMGVVGGSLVYDFTDAVLVELGGWPLFEPFDYKNFRFFRKDCRAYFHECADTDFDYVLHLAAIVGGRLMISYNPIAVAEDLSLDAEFWQWAVRTKPRKIVCFSSSAAYPICFQEPDTYRLLKEEMIGFESWVGVPDLSYGWAKLTHERLAHLAYETHGLKSVIYRPFSGYGEDQDLTYPFPSICKRALENKGSPVLKVWGSGKQMRDFIHIEDCVDGVLATMDKIDDAGALNLSTGVYTSMEAFASMAANLCGYQPEIQGTPDKPTGSFARAGDTTKQRQYGFESSTAFLDGVQRGLSYHSK
jgi:GDP-L-fucose synthase